MWILLAAASLVWIGVLSFTFMAVASVGVDATAAFAGGLLLAVASWMTLLAREFRQAVFHPAPALDDCGDDSRILAVLRSRPDRCRAKPADHRECNLPREVAVEPRQSVLATRRRLRRMARPNRSAAR